MAIRLLSKGKRAALAELRQFCEAVEAGETPTERILQIMSKAFRRVLDDGISADKALDLIGPSATPKGGRPRVDLSWPELEADRPAFEFIQQQHDEGMSIKDACRFAALQFPEGPRPTTLEKRYRC